MPTAPLEFAPNRYKRGWEKLTEIDGEAGENVIASLKDIAPDLGRYIIEFAFGDIYSRPGLALKSRELATVAALTALGNAQPQLKVHIHGALNVGCTREEVVEVIGFRLRLTASQPRRKSSKSGMYELLHSITIDR